MLFASITVKASEILICPSFNMPNNTYPAKIGLLPFDRKYITEGGFSTSYLNINSP
jgi:hypothetical protein